MEMIADGAKKVNGEGKVSHLNKDRLDLLFTECNNIICLQKFTIEYERTVWLDFSSELRVLELCSITNKSIEFLITLIKKSSSLQMFQC